MSYGYGYGFYDTSISHLVRRERERMERARKRRGEARFHLASSQVTLRISGTRGEADRTLAGKVLLNEIHPELCALFSPEPLRVGAMVSIAIEHPRQFYVKAQIVGCRLFSPNSRILSAEGGLPYRVWITPVFETEEERLDVQKYADWILENYLWPER